MLGNTVEYLFYFSHFFPRLFFLPGKDSKNGATINSHDGRDFLLENSIYPNAGVSVGLGYSDGRISFDVGRLRFSQRRQVFHVIVDI